jgi:hypothetical protein
MTDRTEHTPSGRSVLRPAEGINLHGHDTAGRDCLSHTRLGVFLACNQKYSWNYEHDLVPAVKKPSLTMGAAFAHALECGQPQAGYDMVIEEQLALTLEYGSNPWVVAPDEKDALTSATIVRAASGAYLKRYGAQDLRREVTLRARIRNPETGKPSRTFDVQARVDGVTGSHLVEDKFVGQIQPATERKLLLDRQVTLGCYLLWRCERLDVTAVKYRMTKKPAIKQTQKETHGDYLARVEADYVERPDFYLQEFELTRTREDFLRLEHELWTWCEQIRAARRDAVWPRNVAACSDFGGCPYLALCTREPGANHQFARRTPLVSEAPTERKAA